MPGVAQTTSGPLLSLVGRQNGAVLLGPLTTTFTPPTDCTTIVLGKVPYDCNYESGIDLTVATSCLPPALVQQDESNQYFSPGLVCPEGWSTACLGGAAAGPLTRSDDFKPGLNASYSFRVSPGAAQSIAGCCPSGYTCDGQMTGNCVSAVPTTISTFLYGTCDSSSKRFITFTWPLDSYLGQEVSAHMIQMVWQALDLSPPPTSQPASSANSTETTSPQVHRDTPTGAIAGGVVGGVFGLFLIVLLPYLILRSRRKRKEKVSRYEKAELPPDHEKPRVEKDHDGERYELPTNGPISELQGDYPKRHVADQPHT